MPSARSLSKNAIAPLSGPHRASMATSCAAVSIFDLARAVPFECERKKTEKHYSLPFRPFGKSRPGCAPDLPQNLHLSNVSVAGYGNYLHLCH